MERYQKNEASVDMGYPIFRSPRKVDPSGDAIAQQVQKTLGDYELLKSYLGPDLLGVRGDGFFNQVNSFSAPMTRQSCDYSGPKWSGCKPGWEGMGMYQGQPVKHCSGVPSPALKRIHNVTEKPLITSNPPHTQSRSKSILHGAERNLSPKVPASDNANSLSDPMTRQSCDYSRPKWSGSKPGHEGMGNYPGQPVKHCRSVSSPGLKRIHNVTSKPLTTSNPPHTQSRSKSGLHGAARNLSPKVPASDHANSFSDPMAQQSCDYSRPKSSGSKPGLEGMGNYPGQPLKHCRSVSSPGLKKINNVTSKPLTTSNPPHTQSRFKSGLHGAARNLSPKVSASDHANSFSDPMIQQSCDYSKPKSSDSKPGLEGMGNCPSEPVKHCRSVSSPGLKRIHNVTSKPLTTSNPPHTQSRSKSGLHGAARNLSPKVSDSDHAFSDPMIQQSCDYSRPKSSDSKPGLEGMGNYPGQPVKHYRSVSSPGLKRIHNVTSKPLTTSNPLHTQSRAKSGQHGAARNLSPKVPASNHVNYSFDPIKKQSCDYSMPKLHSSKRSNESVGNYPGQPAKQCRGVSSHGQKTIHKPLITSNHQSSGARNLPPKVPASDHLTKAIPPTPTNAADAAKNTPVKPTLCRSLSILRNDLYLSEESEDEEGLPVESWIKVLKNEIQVSKDSEDKIILPVESSMSRTPVKPMSPVKSSSSDSSSEGSDSDSSSDNSSTDDSSSDDSVDESDRLVSGPNNDIKDQRKRGSPAKCGATSSIPKDKIHFGGQSVVKTSRLNTYKSSPDSHLIDKTKSDALSRVFNAKRRFMGGKCGGKEDKKANDTAEIRTMVADKYYDKSSSSVDSFIPSDPVVLLSIPDPEMTGFEIEGELPQTSDGIDIGKVLCPEENIDLQHPDFAIPEKVKLHTQSYYEQKNKEKVEHKKRDKSSDKHPSKTQLKKRERANSPASVLLSVGSTPGCSGANKKIVDVEDKDGRHFKRRKTEGNRSFSENSSADAPINSSSNTGNMRQHYSYLEKPTQRSDYGERCQNQYIDNAKRLKYMADRENDTITQWGLYLKAVLYFVLTGNAMEHESATKEAAFTMYKNTLSLIRFISSKLKNRANQSPDHYKLAVLSYRCEALLYYKLYQMKISEIEEHQKLITQNPVRLSGNSTDLETRVRFNPAHVPDPDVTMSLSVYNAKTEQNQNLAYLGAYQNLWNLADSLVANRNHADFFNQLDLTCKPLSNFTSLIDLVKYVQEGVSRLLYNKS